MSCFFWLTVYKCTTTCTTNRNDGNTSAKYLTTESFTVVMLLTFIISIPRPSLFHSTFKIFLFVYLSHRSLPFLVQDWLHEFPGEIRELRDFVPPHLEKWGYNFFLHEGYEQATNYQYWIHCNLLSGCRINKYVIGLHYDIMKQWRRKFHVSAVNNIYKHWNRTHGPLVAR